MKNYLFFYVNGKEIIERNVEPEWTLLWYLRNKLRLTGSKLGCGVGGCGACTVLISRSTDTNSNEIEHRTVNGCLAPLCSMDGCHIITIEGLNIINKSNVNSIENRFTELFASQCGFCTPGMIMSLYGILTSTENKLSTLQDIEDGFDGNLCRCTGYRPILDAAKTFACDVEKLNIDKSSPTTSTTFDKCSLYSDKNSVQFEQYEFPEKLRNYNYESLHIKGQTNEWYRPVTLKELIQLRHTYPGHQSKIVSGNTRIEIERKNKPVDYTRLISITHIKELQEIKQTDGSLVIGSGVTFARLKSKLTEMKNESLICRPLLDQLKHFASTQIRNVASIGGNIITASPISDINPILLCAGAQVLLQSFDQIDQRKIPLDKFFIDKGRVDIKDNEILVGLSIPNDNSSSNKIFFRSYKQSRRRDDSKGIVSAAFRVELKQTNEKDNQWIIVSICLSFGGLASKTISTSKTQEKLVGLLWNKQTLWQSFDLLVQEIQLNDLSPGGQIQYRKTLAQSLLLKYYSYVCNEIRQPLNDLNHINFNRNISHGQQTIPENLNIDGRCITHCSGRFHARGETTFVADMPSLINTLHAAFVLSTKPHARILKIDTEQASKVDGFVSFVDANDVPGSNKIGYGLDEEVFATSTINCVGTIIGVVVCKTEQAAEKASKLVEIEYELLNPVVLSIDDAIQYQSYFGDELALEQGDIKKAFNESQHILEGTLYIGGQEHFYMETNACLAIPSKDDNHLDLYATTQSPTGLQETIASILDRHYSQVTCHVKRVGGAFGGKESRNTSICAAVSVAAVKLGCSVRISLPRHTDICVTGHRHPFKCQYKVSFSDDGRILAADIHMWNNAGYSLDASEAVMQLAILHFCNVYNISNIKIRGRVCKTHLPSNTAFRGFGGPQAVLSCETIIEHVATFLRKDPLDIRSINLFKEGDRTPYGQKLELWNVPRILEELQASSNFIQRRKEIESFNKINKYHKRGISMIPAKFGIGFVVECINQASALVYVYTDGSVTIGHGGVELGQGLHTKMIGIAAQELGCDVALIKIYETATDKIHNASPTGGSVSADLNGMAVKDACQQIRQRLNEINNENLSWNDLVRKAYASRIDLCARGFYKTPNMFTMDLKNNLATFNYFTQGAAVTEIDLDVLTGDWHIIRVDILMDVGQSLNPKIDIGQIEGGFMQGVGLFTMEELIWGDNHYNKWIPPGELYTNGPDTYKIPSFSDVPIDFRVSLLSNSSNPRAVYSSKGIGEPPILLSISTFFALKQACVAYREDQGLTDYFTLHSPATVERLRMVCVDEFTRRTSMDENGYQPEKGSF